MNSPGVERQRGEEVLIRAVIASRKNELRLRAVRQPLPYLPLVSPDRSDLDIFASVNGAQLGVRKHLLEGGDQLVRKPLAEIGVRHPVVPNNGKLLLFDKAPGHLIDKLFENGQHPLALIGGVPSWKQFPV